MPTLTPYQFLTENKKPHISLREAGFDDRLYHIILYQALFLKIVPIYLSYLIPEGYHVSAFKVKKP
jgi:hypothetical protein